MTHEKPFEEECSNPGHTDRFTCPGCYHDFVGLHVHCAKCGRAIVCAVEYMPVAVCRLAEGFDHDRS